MKDFLRGFIPTQLARFFAQPFLEKQKAGFLADLEKRDQFAHLAYGQEGEDLLLNRYFSWKTNGFYVDVGAHHPQRFSNTYFFYKLGWRGINIDAMPGSMAPFQELRSRDINLEQPISDKEQNLTFYIFNDPALNGFSDQLSVERQNEQFFIKETKTLKTKPLSEVLDQYLPPGQTIDFLSVDVEGLDLQVLKSNNWEKYRPEFVLAECLDTPLVAGVANNEVSRFLQSQGYEPVSKLVHTVIFRR